MTRESRRLEQWIARWHNFRIGGTNGKEWKSDLKGSSTCNLEKFRYPADEMAAWESVLFFWDFVSDIL